MKYAFTFDGFVNKVIIFSAALWFFKAYYNADNGIAIDWVLWWAGLLILLNWYMSHRHVEMHHTHDATVHLYGNKRSQLNKDAQDILDAIEKDHEK